MIKTLRLFSIILLICFSLFGCSEKKAGIEGKLIDGKGKPLSGVWVIIRQIQPAQGYEHFETKTGADGSFQLMGLAPSSDYVITLMSDKWSTRVSKQIQTLEAGQNLTLTPPIKIRFKQMKDGTIMDTNTGLQWLIYPASDITAINVLSTVKGMKEAGFTDWRLPSQQELTGIQEVPSNAKKTCCVWVFEPNSESADWVFYMEEKNDLWTSRKELPENRIVVVRNVMPAAVTAPVDPATKP